jgi:anti-anti-sigma regulatory factor
VAFSFFGKKTSPTSVNRPAPREKPAPAPEPAAPAALPEVADELISLDFTRPGEPPTPVSVVEESESQVPPAIEQAAMLFSADQAQLACSSLEAALHGPSLGSYEQRAWGMLFDLYQQLGKQQAFEILAIEYAGKFETSPPAWRGAGTAPRGPAATSARTSVSLTGVLNAKASESLKQFRSLAEKSPMVRLDLAKLTDAEDQGCALLRDTLAALKKQKRDFILGGADRLVGLLARKITAGKREREPIWLLVLDLYQYLGGQEAFEDTAVNYAITFEVSPPSWEVVREKPPVDDAADEEAGSECVLEGDLQGNDNAMISAIRGAVGDSDEVLVDVSALRRMDFVAATQLMNLVQELKLTGKTVRFRQASHLVSALWEIIGLDRIAIVETRKT